MDQRQLAWRKSSWSATEGECVEVALTSAGAFVRDTKDRDGGTIEMSASAWSAFVERVKQSG